MRPANRRGWFVPIADRRSHRHRQRRTTYHRSRYCTLRAQALVRTACMRHRALHARMASR
ncbi:hypothetical protein AN651_18075 [Xanthomonas arboricola]|nr:hypothetical protein AN651_18075 [Xanthomonas arboricola]